MADVVQATLLHLENLANAIPNLMCKVLAVLQMECVEILQDTVIVQLALIMTALGWVKEIV